MDNYKIVEVLKLFLVFVKWCMQQPYGVFLSSV